MHPTKAELITKNGLRCMLCGKECEYKEINYHHIVPKYVYKLLKIPIDNSYANGSLLCLSCHSKVHEYLYWDDEYQKMMDLVEDNKV